MPSLLAHLTTGADPRAAVAPWWPLVPGAALPRGDRGTDPWADDDPSATLTRLGPLDVHVRTRLVTELLAPAYDALAHGSV